MSLSSARKKFEEAQTLARDPAIAKIPEGLIELARGVENDIRSTERKLESELHTIKNRVNSMRS